MMMGGIAADPVRATIDAVLADSGFAPPQQPQPTYPDMSAESDRLSGIGQAYAAERAGAEAMAMGMPQPQAQAPMMPPDGMSPMVAMLSGIYPDEETPAYAEGGLVGAAEQVAGAGRFGDNYLVHLRPEEMAELQSMYGEPTINPDTGLPEFFLGVKLGKVGKFLKAAVRIGATVGGAAIGGPAGAALGAGLSTKLTGGSWKESLGSAALAGIGSYASAPSGGLLGKGTVLSKSLAGTGIGNALGASAPSALGAPSAALGTTNQFGLDAARAQAMGTTTAAAAKGASGSLLSQGLSAASNAIMQPKNLALIGGGAALATAAGGGGGGPLVPGSGIGDYRIEVGPYDRGFRGPQGDLKNYGQSDGETVFFDRVNPMPQITAIPVTPAAKPKKKAGGGLIRGIGGGQDDVIPGSMDDGSDVLVSNGEYIMDADTVAAIGDGSTDEGAKRLDQWRQRLRAQKRSASAKTIPPKAKAPEAYMKGAR